MKKSNTTTTKITIRKNKRKNKNKRLWKGDISIMNTRRILTGLGKQVYGFGRNVIIVNDSFVITANTFSRVSLNQLFSMPEFQMKKDLFKYFKVNNVVLAIYPNATENNQTATFMFTWKNPVLTEDDVINDDSSRTLSMFSNKTRYLSWVPPNTVIDNNLVFYMNKPQEIGYWSEYPGWLYTKTYSTTLKVNFAMNITLIGNQVKVPEHEGSKEEKEFFSKDKYKIIVIPSKIKDKELKAEINKEIKENKENRKEEEFKEEEEVDWNEEDEIEDNLEEIQKIDKKENIKFKKENKKNEENNKKIIKNKEDYKEFIEKNNKKLH